MSGHNKWSKIKRKKGAEDAKRSKEFSQLSKLITIASKEASGNANAPAVRAAVERAKAVNMPAANIERAIKKGADKDAASLVATIYEAYGPGGVAIIIECLTDNPNRTLQEIKNILSKKNIALAGQGAATWAFTKNSEGWTPTTTVELADEDGEKLAEIIEDIGEQDDVQGVFVNGV